MKNVRNADFVIISLGLDELKYLSGEKASPYEVGRALRFLGIAFVYGVPSAITDAASNSIRCGC